MLKPKGIMFIFLVVALALIGSPVRAQEARQADPRRWKIVFDSPRDGSGASSACLSRARHSERGI